VIRDQLTPPVPIKVTPGDPKVAREIDRAHERWRATLQRAKMLRQIGSGFERHLTTPERRIQEII
jgi:hypothetical protein